MIGGETFVVEPIEPGIYRVSMGTRHWTVAVAGAGDERWIWVDGHVAVLDVAEEADRGRTRRRAASHDLTAPMPATVRRIVAAPHTGHWRVSLGTVGYCTGGHSNGSGPAGRPDRMGAGSGAMMEVTVEGATGAGDDARRW